MPGTDAEWDSYLAQALEETGGPLTPEEVTWADDALAGAEKSSH